MAVVCAVVCQAAWAGPLNGEPVKKYGEFWIAMGGNEQEWGTNWEQFLMPGQSGGDGYPSQPGTPGGEWYPYPNPDYNPGAAPGTPSVAQQNPMAWIPGWHNQWWWDHPYDPNRYKQVWLDFDYMLLDPSQPGLLDIVINWTEPEWPDPNQPPLPGQMDGAIGRELVGQLPLPADPTGANPIQHFEGYFDLRDWGIDYNPEWISVDVAGYNFLISQQEPGSIIHACSDVPEPISAGLMLSALVGLGAYVRRRRT